MSNNDVDLTRELCPMVEDGRWEKNRRQVQTATKHMPCWGRVCHVFAMELTIESHCCSQSTQVVQAVWWKKQCKRDMSVSSCW
jgi:hypothetical protein